MHLALSLLLRHDGRALELGLLLFLLKARAHAVEAGLNLVTDLVGGLTRPVQGLDPAGGLLLTINVALELILDQVGLHEDGADGHLEEVSDDPEDENIGPHQQHRVPACALKQVALSVRLDVAVPVHGHEGGTTQEACHRDQQDGGRLGGALLAEVPPEGGVAGQDDVQLDHAGEGQEDQGRLLARGGHAIVRGGLERRLGVKLRPLKPQIRADEGHQQHVAHNAHHGNGEGNRQILGHVPVQGVVRAVHRVVGGGNDGGVVEHGNQHQDPGGDLEVKDEDGKEEEAQDEHGGGHAVDDVHLQAAEDLAGAHDGNDDGADTLPGQDDICSTLGSRCGTSDGNTDVGLLQGGSIVHTITCHTNQAPLGLQC
mmetsp:Transcript_21970/g.60826  ORF Transcript_21970/g.60826 Transcript_21970/m.60826 type:complete len:370 (+) Transcript_21970:1223-2332(+)